MTIVAAGINIELREILLKDKPAEMLLASAKGTVPVLVLESGEVIDESLDIIHWALCIRDEANWYTNRTSEIKSQIDQLIAINDQQFKPLLDRYKYAARFPEKSQLDYRAQACELIQTLEDRLSEQTYLIGQQISLADIAIFPFIRQFAFVDIDWFNRAEYRQLQAWLEKLMKSHLFNQVMAKQPLWQPGNPPIDIMEGF